MELIQVSLLVTNQRDINVNIKQHGQKEEEIKEIKEIKT